MRGEIVPLYAVYTNDTFPLSQWGNMCVVCRDRAGLDTVPEDVRAAHRAELSRLDEEAVTLMRRVLDAEGRVEELERSLANIEPFVHDAQACDAPGDGTQVPRFGTVTRVNGSYTAKCGMCGASLGSRGVASSACLLIAEHVFKAHATDVRHALDDFWFEYGLSCPYDDCEHTVPGPTDRVIKLTIAHTVMSHGGVL
jgi:hypothetical protein